ncbi:MAG: STAS domain-containing protein [Anaerolineae bacterium]|nr:STAS domain-containing protein [Anaerolineae bacterium]
MSAAKGTRLAGILRNHEADLLEDWLKEQRAAGILRPELLSDAELRAQSREFLDAIQQAVQGGNITDITAPAWKNVRDLLGRISSSRASLGFSPSETATFILSLKQPLFSLMSLEMAGENLQNLLDEIRTVTALLDKLGLYTTEIFIESREQIIAHQHEDLIELSTPVIQVWKGILAVPLVGTLDSARTQIVMESLLQEIVNTSSDIAIIDITGVPTVDTLVAQHLLKTVAAARLMGADCIISGVRPQIAQTIVQLGAEFTGIRTKATLAGALALALKELGLTIQ